MSKDKPPPDAPQLFPRSLKELKRSPIWRQWQEANAKLRESLPPLQCTPQQLRTPRLPADRLVDAIAARARTEANQDLEPEQAPQQQAIEQPPERTIEQAPEQADQLREQQAIERVPEPIEQGHEREQIEQPPEQPTKQQNRIQARFRTMRNQRKKPLHRQKPMRKNPYIRITAGSCSHRAQVPQSPPEQAIEQPAEQTPGQIVEPVLEQFEQAAEQPPEQTSEQVIEQATQAPSRPRHRPRIEFPHLDEALAALEKEPHWKSMQLKEEIAFVMAFLREHGDNVTDDQDKTVGRRIGRWRATRAKRTH